MPRFRAAAKARLFWGALAAALPWSGTGCGGPAAASLASSPFRLDHGQIARLTVRNASFCAGRPDLEATLWFASEAGETMVRRDAVVTCGGSTQLDLEWEGARETPVTANLRFRPASGYPPIATVEVITVAGAGRETGAVHHLRR